MSSKKQPSGDERFSKITKDPRFWEIPDLERKVRIDKRFQSMFHDERFKLKYTVDKRGRPVSHTSTEDLKRFYKLSDSEQEEEEQKEKKKKKTKGKKGLEQEQEQEEEEQEAQQEQEAGDEEEEEPAPEEIIKKNKTDLKPKESEKPRRTRAAGVRVMEEGEEDESEDEDEEDEEDGEGGLSADSDQSDEDDDDSEDEDEEGDSEDDSGSDSGPDLARGKGNIETSSEDEDEEEEEGDLHNEDEEIEHNWGELCKDAPRSEEMSRRLAVCNMDWDRIKAKDLLALLSSFKPKDGVVLSVTIYPSEFGKERMKAEQTQGPLELTSLPDNPEADNEEQRIYREKVRDYQFKRLRYYYAVVECDSIETAAKIYEECDGLEYESSCSMVDLRFIPEDTIFDDEPKDRATDVDLSTYQPKLFTTATTTTAKVELTWDETDHDRVTALSKKFKKDELLDMDFKAYLASSSEDEDEEVCEEDGGAEEEAEELKSVESVKEAPAGKKSQKEDEHIAKYRALLQNIQDKDKKKDKDMEMEVTWVPGLKATTEKLVKKKLEGKDKLTPWEEFLEKKKEKKKAKRKGKKEEAAISDDELPADVDLNDPFFSEELDGMSKKTKKNKKGEEQRTPEEEAELEKQKAEMALLMDDEEEEKHRHFNYDKIVEHQNLSKKKRKKLLKSNTLLEEDGFKVDVQDPRFQAIFTSHLYNLDPSDPAYKKTKGTQSIVEEKLKRREQQEHSQKEALKNQTTPETPGKSREEQETSISGGGGELTSSQKKGLDPSLSMLIKSVKNKTEQFQARKKQRIK